jgi:hypothetical protein
MMTTKKEKQDNSQEARLREFLKAAQQRMQARQKAEELKAEADAALATAKRGAGTAAGAALISGKPVNGSEGRTKVAAATLAADEAFQVLLAVQRAIKENDAVLLALAEEWKVGQEIKIAAREARLVEVTTRQLEPIAAQWRAYAEASGRPVPPLFANLPQPAKWRDHPPALEIFNEAAMDRKLTEELGVMLNDHGRRKRIVEDAQRVQTPFRSEGPFYAVKPLNIDGQVIAAGELVDPMKLGLGPQFMEKLFRVRQVYLKSELGLEELA